MRSHGEQATAGSTKRLGKSKPALLLCALAACAATLALVVGSASGATTRFLVEVFGSSAQPTFPGDRGMAVDQATGELYVLETNTDEIRRYNADGTPSNFSALGSNAIDGEGAEDEIPEGSLDFPSSRSESQIAIDESGGATDGNIYVVERARDQVSIFSSTGAYLGELSAHSGGNFNEPLGVAVDPSGNVYVGDFSSADLIHKYEPAANPPVNGDNSASFNSLAGTSSPGTLAAGAGATAGFIFVNRFNGELFKLDAATGELKYQITTSASTVSVDPTTGHVFVPRSTGSSSEVVEYDASGAAEATKISAFKPGSTVEGVAVANSGERVYVSRGSTENVEVFGPAAIVPDVVTSPPSSNTGVRATLAGTVNPDGVELDECFFEWGQGSGPDPYTDAAPCAQTPAEIGAGTAPVPVSADIDGLIPQGAEYHYRLVAKNPNATINGSNQNFTTPDTVLTEAATGITPTEATLNGTVNPDGTALTECVFEWGPPKESGELIQKFPDSVPCVPAPGGIGSGTSPVGVEADLSELHPGTTYVYRLKAANANGQIVGDPEIVQTTGPAILATWSQDVVRTEATLKAEINPEGTATTYHFEYGTTTAYGKETPEASVGSDAEAHVLTRFIEDLTPATTYHYRVVATNGVAENVGPDLTFTTFEPASLDTACPNQELRFGPSAALPDCRAYELVSPADKEGGEIEVLLNQPSDRTEHVQSAPDGESITYSSKYSFGEQPSNMYSNQYLAKRGPSGWESHGLNAPQGPNLRFPTARLELAYDGFTDDLRRGWFWDDNTTPLTPDGIEGHTNLYRRDADGSFQALTINQPTKGGGTFYGLELTGYSRDGSHSVFEARAAMTPDAAPNTNAQVYEFTGGELRLVSVLPGGEADPAASFLGAGGGGRKAGVRRHAVSEDGSRIFWASQQSALYVRIDGEQTKTISADFPSRYWDATPDGSEVLFTVGLELFKFDVDAETVTLVAEEAFGQGLPSEVPGVVGSSDDLSHVYFVSRQALAVGATAGEYNLYLDRDGTKTFVATVSAQDVRASAATASSTSLATGRDSAREARVSADGSTLAFTSDRSLTGYDNTAPSGEPAREIYVYDANAGRLICASCNQSGARPVARRLPVPFGKTKENGEPISYDIWVAAWLMTTPNVNFLPRDVSADGGRVFFNSFDALVPEDTNGAQDVYQWEARGTGTCDRPDGCVSLISTGRSPEKSQFVEASADGEDVFFYTAAGIDPDDPAATVDIYDARVGGGYPRPEQPSPCVGDSCQNVPATPRDPTPASAGFRGAGDPTPRRSCTAAARRAMKLSRRAKRMRRMAKRSHPEKRSKQLRRRSKRYAGKAKRLSRNAKRCRRANRRAGR